MPVSHHSITDIDSCSPQNTPRTTVSMWRCASQSQLVYLLCAQQASDIVYVPALGFSNQCCPNLRTYLELVIYRFCHSWLSHTSGFIISHQRFVFREDLKIQGLRAVFEKEIARLWGIPHNCFGRFWEAQISACFCLTSSMSGRKKGCRSAKISGQQKSVNRLQQGKSVSCKSGIKTRCHILVNKDPMTIMYNHTATHPPHVLVAETSCETGKHMCHGRSRHIGPLEQG